MEDRLTLPASETKTRREELENLRTKIREDDFCRFLMKYMYQGQFWSYRCIP